jgi:hypothetical protein
MSCHLFFSFSLSLSLSPSYADGGGGGGGGGRHEMTIFSASIVETISEQTFSKKLFLNEENHV